MAEISAYTSRLSPADLDTITIVPSFPDFLVYGTYSIIKRTEIQSYSAQIRSGAIHTLPVSPLFDPAYAGMLPPKLASYHFSAAVLDIRFHPNDGGLLGVALSDGTIEFFRFVKRADVLGRRVLTEMFPLGGIKVFDADPETAIVPLVTQFQWFSTLSETGRRDVSNTLGVKISLALSSGDVGIVKTRIRGIRSTHDHRLALSPKRMEAVIETVHGHELEAWCVYPLSLPGGDSDDYILFSGGDDSALIGSTISFNASPHLTNDLLLDVPTQLFKDRRTFNAGVTSILPLPLPNFHPTTPTSIFTTAAHPIPVLVGSYDESLSLFTFNLPIYKPKLQNSLSLRGGVWRIQLMDSYIICLPTTHEGLHLQPKQFEHHYIVLISAMHAGANILRVAYNERAEEGKTWQLKLEASFTKGHETLVYACDFRKEWRGDVLLGGRSSPKAKKVLGIGLGNGLGRTLSKGKGAENGKENSKTAKAKDEEGVLNGGEEDIGRYTVISTSFYDRKICNWEWKDERRIEGES